jgi:actin-related protein
MAENIVMDTGSGYLKFGFPGEDMPKFTEPN